MDPNMKKEITGDPGTVGHRNSWTSDNPMVGNGNQEIVEVEKNVLMKNKMNFEGDPRDHYASFALSEDSISIKEIDYPRPIPGSGYI